MANDNSDESGASVLSVSSGTLGGALMNMLVAGDIQPGDAPSYELCKTIYLYHPLGAKMAEAPINLVQSQQRDISVDGAPNVVKEVFIREWRDFGADRMIHNVKKLSRVYGIASLAVGIVGEDPSKPMEDWHKLATGEVYVNVLDPLNTSGSLVLDQDPNSPTFQKHRDISAQGTTYHRSRICVVMNEEPIYLSYTGSAFGFSGRSVYQRALYPLKTFIRSMITDEMITRKAGLLIYKMKPIGSIVDRVMTAFAALRRNILKSGGTNEVASIDVSENIESLNMMNIDGAAGFARENVLKNVATSADMPAALLRNEEMVSGFAEGEEDAKNIARYIDRLREEMSELYAFITKIVMYRAWNEDFYKGLKAAYPKEYGRKSYKVAFSEWERGFEALWPSLLIEPESKKIDVEDVKLKSIVAIIQVMAPELDPANKARLFDMACRNISENKLIFPHPLLLDIEELRDYAEEMQEAAQQMNSQGGAGGPGEPSEEAEATPQGQPQEPKAARPFAPTDGQPTRLHLRLLEEDATRASRRRQHSQDRR